MTMILHTDSDARAAEDRFNGFHDAFFRRITLSSGDSFSSDGSHLFTGDLTLEMEIAHCNYVGAEDDPHRIVRTVFSGVRNVAFFFSGRQCEWSIHFFSFHGHHRASEAGEPEPCLLARLVQNVYDPPEGWRLVSTDVFSFIEASIVDRSTA